MPNVENPMYLIFNEDGSVKYKKLNYFIQQGNSYVNVLFLSIIGRSPETYNLTAKFILPNEMPGEVISAQGQTGSIEIDGKTYYGRYISLTSDQTVLSGALKLNISAIRVVDNAVLVSTTTYLQVNEGSSPSDPVIMTIAEYTNLIAAIGEEVKRYETIFTIDDIDNAGEPSDWRENQAIYELSTSTLYAVEDGQFKPKYTLSNFVKKTGDTMTGDLNLGLHKLKIGGYYDATNLWEIYQTSGAPGSLYIKPGGLSGSAIYAPCQAYFHTIYPVSNNTYDLGASTNKWKDLWLSGLLRDGTNSVSIADISTKSYTLTLIQNNLNNLEYLKDSTFTYNGDTVKFVKTKHKSTGQTETIEEVVQLADSEHAGLMSPSTVQGIQQLTSDVAALKGQTIRLLYTAKSNPTAAEILAFVQSKGYTDTSKYAGIAVVIQATNHIWKWLTDDEVFNDFGLDTVNQFTNSQAGVIKGSNTKGKVYAEDDGTGSVVGFDDLETDIENLKETKLDVPSTAPITITPDQWDESGEFEYDLAEQGIEVGDNDLITVYAQSSSFYVYHLSYREGSTNTKIIFKVLGTPTENIELLVEVAKLGGNENA